MWNPFRPKQKRGRAIDSSDPWPLDLKLLSLGKDPYTLRDAYGGVLILGGPGSSKTTATGRLIGESLLAVGAGGLILTAKPDEVPRWVQYVKNCGRLDDLVIFGPETPGCGFNFLLEEYRRAGAGAGITSNLEQLLTQVVEITERAMGQGGGGGGDNEAYFRRAAAQTLKNCIEVLIQGTGSVNIPDLLEVVSSLPNSQSEAASPEWQANSAFYRFLQRADGAEKTSRQRKDLKLAASYGMEWANLSDKTRSVTLSCITSMLDILGRGIVRELMCENTTITPEQCFTEGKIILMGTPIREWGVTGQVIQVIFKLLFIKALERRNVDLYPVPVTLFCDEMQDFLLPQLDMRFLCTSRSARVAAVLITQNVPNILSVLAQGSRGEAEANSLLGCLGTHFYHANSCSKTNEYAATRIGRCSKYLINMNQQDGDTDLFSAMAGQSNRTGGSCGMTETINFEVEPQEFFRLSPGGPENNWVADAIVARSGKPFKSTGRNWMRITVSQK